MNRYEITIQLPDGNVVGCSAPSLEDVLEIFHARIYPKLLSFEVDRCGAIPAEALIKDLHE